MKSFLGLASVFLLLAGCSTPANRELGACEEFFSIPASVVAGSDDYIASVVGLGDEFAGTSIGRALGEYGQSLQSWADDADWNNGFPDLEDEDAVYYNASLWKIASDQEKEIVSRCDELLTAG